SLVQEEGQASPERAHHGPKPPVAVMVRSFLWVWLLGGLALAVALLVLRRRLAGLWRRPERDTPAEPFFDDLALERLRELRTEAPWTRGRGRAAIFALSEIVRAYLGARLQFNALDLTREELVAELRRRGRRMAAAPAPAQPSPPGPARDRIGSRDPSFPLGAPVVASRGAPDRGGGAHQPGAGGPAPACSAPAGLVGRGNRHRGRLRP